MKTSFQKQSFGGGFGINRGTGGARSLPTAVPPMSNVSVRPGNHSRSATGKSGKSHYAGAKVIGSKK